MTSPAPGPAWPRDVLGVALPWEPPSPGAVRVDRREMMRYLGYRHQELDAELVRRIDRTVAGLEADVVPRGSYIVLAVEDASPGTATGDGGAPVRLRGTTLSLPGRDIARLLEGARWCAVLCCTLGMRLERRLRVASSQSPLDGALLDSAASAYVEAATEALNRDIAQRAAAAGLSCTRRYSPGYGDLPLGLQPELLSVLNAGRLCGLTATATNLLMPTKSVTAVLGLGEHLARPLPPSSEGRHNRGCHHSCATCSLGASCPYREEPHA